jgi:hypothetical protein
MADDVDAPVEETAVEPSVESERTFTAKEVEAIVRDRLNRQKRSMEKQVEPKKEEAPAQPDQSVAEMKLRLDFTDALDEIDWKPSKEQKPHLLTAFKTGGKDAMVSLAGMLKPAAAAPAPVADKVPVSSGPAHASVGAPNSPPEVLESDPTKWSKDYISRLRSEGTFRSELEKKFGVGTGGLFQKKIPK